MSIPIAKALWCPLAQPVVKLINAKRQPVVDCLLLMTLYPSYTAKVRTGSLAASVLLFATRKRVTRVKQA